MDPDQQVVNKELSLLVENGADRVDGAGPSRRRAQVGLGTGVGVLVQRGGAGPSGMPKREREFFIDNLLVRIH